MKSFLIILIFCTVLFTNCTKPFCGESTGLEQSALGVHLFDKATNEYFYPELGPSLYNKDSFQVFNEDGRKLERIGFGLVEDPRNNLKRFYGVTIAPAFMMPGDEDAYNAEKTRKIYLKYNSTTADTLMLVYKAHKNECDKYIYEYLKVYHRSILVSSISDEIFTVFQLNH